MNFQTALIDFFDDAKGSILREFFPTRDTIPAFIKTASVGVTQQSAPSDFALILVSEDGSQVLKKFATVDKGHTFLSATYFHRTHESLPKEAQKVAAVHIRQACAAYGIGSTPLLDRLAGDGLVDSNVVSFHDVSAPSLTEVSAPVYALEREDGTGQYPLTGPESVKTADVYFQEHYKQMPPQDRREYAVKVAALAELSGLPVSEELRGYAGDEYNPNLPAYLAVRAEYLPDDPEPRSQLAKLASAAKKVSPTQFAGELEAFDRQHGLDELWDGPLPDAYYSTFNTKVAEEKDVDGMESFTVGLETTTAFRLRRLAEYPQFLSSRLGHQFVNSFILDPVGEFKAAPTPLKKLLVHMSNDVYALK